MTDPAFTDDVLSAWLDGEVDEATSAAILRAIGADPSLADRLSALRSNDTLLRRAFDEALPEPVPEGLTRLLEPRAAQVIAFDPRTSKRSSPRWNAWQGAAAAGVAGLLVFAGVNALRPTPPAMVAEVDGAPMAGRDLASALSATPSGRDAPSRVGVVKVALSFRSNTGGLCRQFSVSQSRGQTLGVACRDGGGWRIEALSRSGDAAAKGEFRTAGGDNDTLLDETLERMGVRDVLDAPTESAAIRSGWR